jgi:hypothetical protein
MWPFGEGPTWTGSLGLPYGAELTDGFATGVLQLDDAKPCSGVDPDPGEESS